VSAVRNVDSLVAVGVSCFTDLSKDSAQEAIASLREVIDESVVVFLGGASIPDLETAQSLGADEWARDARDFVETLERVLKDRNKQRAG
jgi:methanogenic corrinoid protein MtbC1